MENLTVVSRRTAQLIRAAKITDERDIMVQTKIARLQSSGASQKSDTIAKSVITAALFGFYSVPTPIDFVLALRDDTIILIKSPRRGGIIKRPTVRKEEIMRRVEIAKEEIIGAFVEKEDKLYKLNLQLNDGFTLVIDVTQKTIPAINIITKTLGFLDCWL